MTLARRHLLAGLGAGLGLGLLTGGGSLRAFAQPAATIGGGRRKTLVCVFQRGAVDGLAMVPPYADPDLAAARPRIAVPRPGQPDGALDLDGRFGLHPALAALAPRWQQRQLAVVHAVGLPGAGRSHFEAQDLLEQGGSPRGAGWVNRLLAGGAPDDTRAIAVGEELPRALAGGHPALVIARSGDIGIARGAPAARRGALASAFAALYADRSDPVSVTGRRALAAADRLGATLAAVPSATATYPGGALGKAMATASRLIRAELGTEVILVEVGGWDTHTDQPRRLTAGLRELGGSLAAFGDELGDRLADVVVVTLSEFGRTVAENGSGGTDHGTATASLVFGGPVAGGRVLGRWPGLAASARFEQRDLAITSDLRDVLGELLAGHLGASASQLAAVFPDHARAAPLGLLG